MASDIIARALAIKANKTLPAISSADAGKLATVDSNGKWAAAELDVGQGEVAVDSTLLVSGAAADAKATGDKVNELKSAVDNLGDDFALFENTAFDGYAPNLIESATIVAGYYIAYGSGVPTANSSYSYADYIPVVAGSKYMCNIPAQYAYYNASKTYVSGGTNASQIDTIPSGAAFVRISMLTANISTYYFAVASGVAFKIKDSVIPQAQGMNDTLFLEEGYKPNLAHSLPMVDGQYVSATGSIIYGTTYSRTDYIGVTAGEKYYSNCVAPYSWFDSQKKFISGGNTFDGVNVAPAGATYIMLSVLTTAKINLRLYQNDFPYVWNGEVFENVLTVGTGKMYTSLRDAFDACTPNSNLNRYKIEFYGDGTDYDVSQDFTSAEESDPDFWGLFVPPFSRLVGMGNKENNILSLTLATPSVKISALNLYNTSSLENMTIKCTGGRYAVHDDLRSANPYSAKIKKTVKNCVMIGTDLNNDQAYGAGYAGGEEWLIEDCVFITNSTDNYAFAAHNLNNQTQKTTVRIVNCRMKTGGTNTATAFGSQNTSTVPNEIFIIGTETNGLKLYENGGKGIKTRISGYANDVKSSDVVIDNTDGLDYTSWVSLI